MLTQALQQIKELVYSNEEANIDQTITSIATETGLSHDDLVIYYNLMCETKVLIEAKNLTSLSKQNWLDPEVKLMHMYISIEKEKQGIEPAAETLSGIIGREPKGIIYKFYNYDKKLRDMAKNGGVSEKKVETRGRKKKLTSIDKTTNAESQKQIIMSSDNEINVEAKDNVSPSNSETNTASTQAVTPSELTPNENQRTSELERIETTSDEKQHQITTTNSLQHEEDIESTNTVTVIDRSIKKPTESRKHLNAVELVSGFVQNMNTVHNLMPDYFDKNTQLFNLLEGLYALSDVAAKNAEGAQKYSEMARRAEMLEKENKVLVEDNEEVAKAYRAQKQINRELLDAMEKHVGDFEKLESTEQLIKLNPFQKQLKYTLNRYNEVVATNVSY